MATHAPTTGALSCAPSTSRRALLGAAVLAPMAAAAATSPAMPTSGDTAILNAWARRQAALAVIETRGVFYDCETHSPIEADAFSRAEDEISNLTATTPKGALIQLWIAFDHCGTSYGPEDRYFHAFRRRADLDSLRGMKRLLDYNEEMILAVLETLSAIGGRV